MAPVFLFWMQICLQIFANFVVSDAPSTLRFAHVMFRHGDRSPMKTFPTDPYQEDAWPQGFQQLTQLGMQQEYDLGRFLREWYNGFLNETFIDNEIYVRSTDRSRTLMSAQSMLAGMYPPKGWQIWNPDIPWQPIPVHTVQLEDDLLLNVDVPCDKYTELFMEVMHSDVVYEYEEENKEFLDYVKKHTGMKDASFLDVMLTVPGAILAEDVHNFTLDDWITEEVIEGCWHMEDMKQYWNFSRPEMVQLRGGIFLQTVVNNTNDFLTKKIDPATRKGFFYAAHDTSLASALAGLGVWDGLLPPYATAVMIEIHEVAPGDHRLRVYLKNTTLVDVMGKPYQLQIPDCELDCPWGKFLTLIDPMLILNSEEWEDMCQVVHWQKHYEGTAIAVCLFIIIIATLLTVVCVLCYRKQKDEIPYQSANFSVEVPHA